MQVTILENGKHMAAEMDNLTTLVEDLHVEFNKTRAVPELSDDQGTNHQEALKKNMNLLVDKVISNVDKNANNFITKVRLPTASCVCTQFHCVTKSDTSALTPKLKKGETTVIQTFPTVRTPNLIRNNAGSKKS
jgi:hypothetical protein